MAHYAMYFHVPNFIVGIFGRGFFRMVKAVPALFLLICAVGLAVCAGALFLFGGQAKNLWEEIVVRSVGVLGIPFYGGLAIMYFVKRRRETWGEFCDWAHSIFESM